MSRPELSLATEYTIQANKPNFITLLTKDCKMLGRSAIIELTEASL